MRTAADLTGELVNDRYRVVGPLGEGAMGSVYRAVDQKLGRVVAIKVMNETLSSGDPSIRKRFEREAKAMARLEHPHCASVLDVGVHEETPFVVMELVSGQSLKDLVEQGPMPVLRAVEIMRQVLSGLAHAHELGVVHRDIKPANIMLSQKAGLGDHVKLLDFGLARLTGETSNLTAGVVLGTPSYMAPEQVRGILLDGRADLYACGVTLFELVTGTKPFRVQVFDPVAICMKHMTDPIPRLEERLPGHDFGAIQHVIDRAMAKDREQRFQNANAFAAALAEVVGSDRKVISGPVEMPTSHPTAVASAASAASSPTTSLAPMASPTWSSPSPPSPPSRPTPPPPPRPSQPAVSPHGATSFLGPASSMPLPETPPQNAPPFVAPIPAAKKPSIALFAIGGGIAVAAVIGIVLATSGGNGNAQPVRDAGVVATSPVDASTEIEMESEPTADDGAAADVLAKANGLVAAGRDMSAIDLLVKARRAHPKDARIPFLAGKLFARKMYFHDAFKHLRPAFVLDPLLREDSEVAESIVRGFNAKYGYDSTIASFLRTEMPAAAKPILERTAKSHGNAMVRKRAAAELQRYP